MQGAFSRTVEQMVVDLRLMTDEHHLLVRWKDELISKKTLERRITKKIVEEVFVGESQSS